PLSLDHAEPGGCVRSAERDEPRRQRARLRARCSETLQHQTARGAGMIDVTPVRARAAAPVAWYRTYQSQRSVRSLAGARILREFERASPEAFSIQVGSNDGEQHAPLRVAILRRRWHGIMIEPVPYVFQRLRANYGPLGDRIALENVAIGAVDGTV